MFFALARHWIADRHWHDITGEIDIFPNIGGMIAGSGSVALAHTSLAHCSMFFVLKSGSLMPIGTLRLSTPGKDCSWIPNWVDAKILGISPSVYWNQFTDPCSFMTGTGGIWGSMHFRTPSMVELSSCFRFNFLFGHGNSNPGYQYMNFFGALIGLSIAASQIVS